MKEWLSQYNPFNSIKVLAWADHIRGIIKDDFFPPVVVNWDLVLGCNYQCPHCIWHKRRNLQPKKVPNEMIRQVPEFLHDWGVKGVCIAGESGDPSLHPDLGVALRLLHHWNLEVGYVSNGFVMNDVEAVAHYCKFAGFSIDAGAATPYSKVHGVQSTNFWHVLGNIEHLASYATKYRLPVQIGYKFLILPDSYLSIYEGAQRARDIGVRDFQIRPAELPLEEIQKIDIERLTEQLDLAHRLESENFHIYSIRHKFTDCLTKKPQKRCWATPLTSTWLATGEVVCCVDLRDEQYNTLCNYQEDGLAALRELWGGFAHRNLIWAINQKLDNCKRCTNGGYNEIIENVFIDDNMDLRLI